jgi:hypothetical protein
LVAVEAAWVSEEGSGAESDIGAFDFEEVVPAFVAEAIFVEAEEGAPARGDGFAERVHVGLVGEFVGLAGVAADAGGDDVFPGGASAFVAREDVVEVELGFREDFGAVLAGELVAEEDVAAGEFDFEAREFVVDGEDEDFGCAEAESDAVDHFLIEGVFGVADP